MEKRYILDHWVNGDYESRVLRTITRENKRYLVADVQRDAKDWKVNGGDIKTFYYPWAKKYVKDNSELGFRRSITRRSNTDGTMHYTFTTDPSTLKCPYTLGEVFGNDLREIQNPKNNPLAQMLREEERRIERKGDYDVSFKIDLSECKNDVTADSISGWDKPIVDYLRDLFKVDKVYYIFDTIREYHNQSILTKSGTLFHLNHFNLNKKEITFDENYFNRTIMYWLFDGCLVFQYEEGKETF